ncbi:IS3 family transposase [Streptosporangium sp. OZ121]|uniref:IS3 family transposase n=1 Tax=Streptosporangium sp. OZ121 TaxID=3444183 RepID=UPI003F79DD0E
MRPIVDDLHQAGPLPRVDRDAELAEHIAEVHARSRGSYGAPRVHAQLQRDGEQCGRRRVARLMRALGLAGRYRRLRQRATIPGPGTGTRPDLIGRDFTPDAAGLDTRWCGDVTYIAIELGPGVCHQRLLTRSNASILAPLTLRRLSNSPTEPPV